MPNPTTAAGWLRGIPYLDSQQMALLKVAMDASARQRAEAFRERAASLLPCWCDKAYKDRGLKQPDCPQCQFGDEIRALEP